jgi:hypothetical protein
MIVQVLDALGKIKRKHERYVYRLPVTCCLREKASAGTVLDIGRGGFSARFKQALLVGEKIGAEMLLGEGEKHEQFTTTAEVVWSSKLADSCSHGFKFVNLDKAQIKTLKTFLGPPAALRGFGNVSRVRFGMAGPGYFARKYAAEKYAEKNRKL